MKDIFETFRCEPIPYNHDLRLDGFSQRHGQEINWLKESTIGVFPKGIFSKPSTDYLTETMVELRQAIRNSGKNSILSIGSGITWEPLQTAAYFSNTAVIAIDGHQLFSDNPREIPKWMVEEIADNKSLVIGFKTYTSELEKTLRKHLKFPKVHIFCPVPMSQRERILQAIDFLEPSGKLIVVCDPRSQFEEFYPSNYRDVYYENNPRKICQELKRNEGLTEIELHQLTLKEVEEITGANDSPYLEPESLKYLQATYKTETIPVITLEKI